jgi:hypothetical protein
MVPLETFGSPGVSIALIVRDVECVRLTLGA